MCTRKTYDIPLLVLRSAAGYTIYKGDGLRLILTKQQKITDTAIFIELTPADGEDFYDVKTGLIARKNYFKNKTPLWIQSTSGVQGLDR